MFSSWKFWKSDAVRMAYCMNGSWVVYVLFSIGINTSSRLPLLCISAIGLSFSTVKSTSIFSLPSSQSSRQLLMSSLQLLSALQLTKDIPFIISLNGTSRDVTLIRAYFPTILLILFSMLDLSSDL